MLHFSPFHVGTVFGSSVIKSLVTKFGDLTFMGCRISGLASRWRGAILPYEIDIDDFPRNSSTRLTIMQAIAHWNDQSSVVLVPKRKEADSLLFVEHGSSCQSSVGRVGGRQRVRCNLDEGSFGFGSIVHEIGHALGLWHEQSREDRDDFVTINLENVPVGRRHNFDRHVDDGDDVGNYDYGSIMHYSSRAFAIDASIPTIEAPEPIGQRNGLSAGDIAGIADTYEESIRRSRGWKGLWISGVDAAVNHPNGKAYFFRGSRYQRFDFQKDCVDKTGSIDVDGWKGLWTTGIDAAVNHPNGKAYFFKGNQYQRFDFALDRVDKTALIGKDGWRGLWADGIDAAVNHPNGNAYFFKENRYQRFNFELDRVNKTARIDISGWKGLWGRLNAAVNHPNGKAYFFRDELYKRFDFSEDRVNKISFLLGN